MRKKNTIRLNESELKNIVKESVKKIVNETSDNANASFNNAIDKAEKDGRKDVRREISDEWYYQVDSMKEARNHATEIRQYLNSLIKYNPRISEQYMHKLIRACNEIYYAFDENGPIADAIINQISNRWHHQRQWNDKEGFHWGKPYKGKDIGEPADDNEEYDEPEDWYERNEHGDFDRFY